MIGLLTLWINKHNNDPEFMRRFEKVQDVLVKLDPPTKVKEFIATALVIGAFIYFTLFYE